MFIKSILQDILPAPVMEYAEAVRQQVQLAAIAPAELFPDSLKPSNDFLVPRILADGDAALTWENDAPEIERYFINTADKGSLNAGDRRAVYTIVRALKPSSVLEIGTHTGSSALYIARALRTNGGGHLTTVDLYDVNDAATGSWQKFGMPAPVRQMMQECGLDERVTFNALDPETYLRQTDLNFDLIFLDGDPAASSVYSQVSMALRRLSPDGLLILHDYYPSGRPLYEGEPPSHGPFLGLRRIMSEQPQVHVIPFGELPWDVPDNQRKTSLAAVVKHPVG